MTPAAARSYTPSAPPPYPADAGSGEIREEIRRTRAEMDETVDALGERLKPRHLLDDFLDMFRGSGGGSGGGTGGGGGTGNGGGDSGGGGGAILTELALLLLLIGRNYIGTRSSRL